MPRKPAASRGRQRQVDDEADGGGLVARVIDRTFENPAMTGGLLVMALTAAAIVSNALLLQGAWHPDPLFGLRSEGGGVDRQARSSPIIVDPPMPHLAPRGAVPMPSVAPDPVAELSVTPPADIPAIASEMPRAEPAPAAEALDPAERQAALIMEIQRELARIGLYNGAIDGLAGSRTEAAVKAFEVAAGIAVTGTPSPQLLAALKQPLPPRNTQSIAAASTADAEAEELNRRERERARLIEADRLRRAEIKALETYKVVQAALNRIGYGPLPVDGSDVAETQDAIRRFELDNGMPITGQANDALIARLVAIGAIKPG